MTSGGEEIDQDDRDTDAGFWDWLKSVLPVVGRRLMLSSRFWLGAFVVFLILVHGLAPDDFRVDTLTIALLVILLVLALRPYLKSFSLPGGGGGVFRDEVDAIREKVELAEAVPAQRRPVSGAAVSDGPAINLEVPAALRDLASVHPNAALAGLRIELEKVFTLEGSVVAAA